VNDEFGHAAGDRTLVSVARAVARSSARETSSRVGGDEFVVLCGEQEGPAKRWTSRSGFGRVEALGPADGVPLPLSVSVGVAMAEPDDDEDSLLRRADHAMYARKHGVRVARAR
jgi:diguanylate cyclase (GGDEF)-like protein